MKLRTKPVFDEDIKLFVIQQEKEVFGLRYWRDIRDIHGYPVMCTPEEVQSAVTHLTRGQEI